MSAGKHPTAPAIVSRVPVFAPSLKRWHTYSWSGRTQWGVATVEGRLTQTHRALLDAICATALDWRDAADGSGARTFLTDPYQLAKATGFSRDYKWLRARLEDMRGAKVHITPSGGGEMVGGIVSQFWLSEQAAHDPLRGGTRKMLAITLSGPWMLLFKAGVQVHYPELLQKIAMLRSGAAQALARFAITHQQLNMKLDDVLTHIHALRPDLTERAHRKTRQAVLADVAQLAALGVRIENGVVFFNRELAQGVRGWVEHAAAEPICADAAPICAATEPICAGGQDFQDPQGL